jgi:pyruvate dehydrogenase E1 component beta subunit
VGATHSHTPENICANHPGVKVVVPATPYDAKGLLKSAIRDNDPVMFMENTILYGDKGEVPDEEYLIPLGKADVKRVGEDLTIVAHGRAVITALAAAEQLKKEHDISAEVVDLRTIRPLDEETILASVRKTHRALLVEENKPFCGVDAQIAYLIQDKAFDDLDAPIKRISAIDAPAIYSPPMESEQLPTAQRIIKAAIELVR